VPSMRSRTVYSSRFRSRPISTNPVAGYCASGREMTYDPLPALRALRVPALFLFGADDRLIPVEKSVSAIREVLTQGRADFTIQVLDAESTFPPHGRCAFCR